MWKSSLWRLLCHMKSLHNLKWLWNEEESDNEYVLFNKLMQTKTVLSLNNILHMMKVSAYHNTFLNKFIPNQCFIYFIFSFFYFFCFLPSPSSKSFSSYFGVIYSHKYLPNFTTINTTTSQYKCLHKNKSTKLYEWKGQEEPPEYLKPIYQCSIN